MGDVADSYALAAGTTITRIDTVNGVYYFSNPFTVQGDIPVDIYVQQGSTTPPTESTVVDPDYGSLLRNYKFTFQGAERPGHLKLAPDSPDGDLSYIQVGNAIRSQALNQGFAIVTGVFNDDPSYKHITITDMPVDNGSYYYTVYTQSNLPVNQVVDPIDTRLSASYGDVNYFFQGDEIYHVRPLRLTQAGDKLVCSSAFQGGAPIAGFDPGGYITVEQGFESKNNSPAEMSAAVTFAQRRAMPSGPAWLLVFTDPTAMPGTVNQVTVQDIRINQGDSNPAYPQATYQSSQQDFDSIAEDIIYQIENDPNLACSATKWTDDNGNAAVVLLTNGQIFDVASNDGSITAIPKPISCQWGSDGRLIVPAPVGTVIAPPSTVQDPDYGIPTTAYMVASDNPVKNHVVANRGEDLSSVQAGNIIKSDAFLNGFASVVSTDGTTLTLSDVPINDQEWEYQIYTEYIGNPNDVYMPFNIFVDPTVGSADYPRSADNPPTNPVREMLFEMINNGDKAVITNSAGQPASISTRGANDITLPAGYEYSGPNQQFVPMAVTLASPQQLYFGGPMYYCYLIGAPQSYQSYRLNLGPYEASLGNSGPNPTASSIFQALKTKIDQFNIPGVRTYIQGDGLYVYTNGQDPGVNGNQLITASMQPTILKI